MHHTRQIKLRIPGFIAIAVFINGCFFQPSPPTAAEQSEKIEQTLASGGYSATSGYAIDSLLETWLHDGLSIDIAMTLPKAPGRYPVVVYLPGLGERADAGRLWRETWAKAGYAVFAVQPRDTGDALARLGPVPDEPGFDDDDEPDDNSGWSGPSRFFGSGDEEEKNRRRNARALRKSELRYLGHEYFSPAALKSRVNHVLWAVQQLKQRAATGQAGFRMADTSRVIVAGYDIGAQTTAALVGENFATELPATDAFRPLGAMLFSPVVDLAVGNVATRYRNIAVPFLAVTGAQDNDPYAIGSAQSRAAIWDYATPGNKYLLSLASANHRLLAGTEWARRRQFGRDERGLDGGRAGFTGGRDANLGGGLPPGAAGVAGVPLNGKLPEAYEDYRQIAAIFSVSTAFLDSVVKADNFAGAWLEEKAPRWLGKSAVLKIK